MVTKTTTRPPPRSSQSHSHSSSQRTHSKSSTTPMSPAARVPASVGQSLPPNSVPHLRSPAAQEVRTPSPNYFGLVVDPTTDPRSSVIGPKDNWSPPTSSILSFGAVSPKHLPVDSNPEFEAFRKRTESHNGFSLGHGNLSHFASTPGSGSMRPRMDRNQIRSDSPERSPSPKSISRPRDFAFDRMEIDRIRDSAYSSEVDSVRSTGTSSLNATSFFDLPRQQSPSTMSTFPVQRNVLSHLDDRHPRLSLPQNRADPPSPHHKVPTQKQHRADTLPSSLEDGPAMISPRQLKELIERLPSADLLLLDLRVFPQFSQSRIRNALNLCIPTTLLKRPSFNLQKLADTFTNETEKERFAGWETAKYIVVYDAMSYERKDAASAVNTIKKFTNEGYKGNCSILKGGFAAFMKSHPSMVDTRSSQEMQSSKMNLSLGTSIPDVAPVAGGCMMPATQNAANPFFSNIRQNQDLIGGVGQMSVKLPEDFSSIEEPNILPKWILEAAAKEDHGKKVSDKFLHLEIDEQTRMTKALTQGAMYGTPVPNSKEVQIAGIEKGGKNRYNNIWPFEHARVRLQGRSDGACDYVNASHIKASRSNKRYIASQGPLPATFDDFWSVIWDQDVRVIVMLTAETEGGQLKCHPYWSSREYGPLNLKALSEKKVSLDPSRHRVPADRRECGRRRANTSAETSPPVPTPTETPHAIVRKFALSHAAHPFSPIREITQVHYSSWPDFGAPASPSQLLGLVELSNQMQRAASSKSVSPRSSDPESEDSVRPMLVHCSAGCGRTGTFCTVDSVIDMLKRQRKEVRSGVTPMEFTSSTDSDYMGKGKDTNTSPDDWIFNQDLDLVEKTVEDFRGQRLSMVQSLRQYVLCYESVLEWMAQQYAPPRQTGRERSGSHGAVIERTFSDNLHGSRG